MNNVNKALEQYQEAEHKDDVAKMIALQSAIKFNGGGGLKCPVGRALQRPSQQAVAAGWSGGHCWPGYLWPAPSTQDTSDSLPCEHAERAGTCHLRHSSDNHPLIAPHARPHQPLAVLEDAVPAQGWSG